jgi:hypothetical protein
MDQSLADEHILLGRISALREKGYTWEDIAAMLGFEVRTIYKIALRGSVDLPGGFDHIQLLVGLVHKGDIVRLDQMPEIFRKNGVAVRPDKCKVIIKDCVKRGLFERKSKETYVYTGKPIDNMGDTPLEREKRAKRAQLILSAAHPENAIRWNVELTDDGIKYLKKTFNSDDITEYPIRDYFIRRDEETGQRSGIKGADEVERFSTYGALLVLSHDTKLHASFHKLSSAGDAVLEYVLGATSIFLRPTLANLDEQAISDLTIHDLPEIRKAISEHVRQASLIGKADQPRHQKIVTLVTANLI